MDADGADRKLRILVFVAHPHDCVHCLGTCGHHVRDGDTVTVAVLSDGGSTHNEKLWRELLKPADERDPSILQESREQYIDLKRKELVEACGYFGITDVRLLGHPDKPITRTDAMVEEVAALIFETRPDILITELPAHLDPGKAEPNDHTTCAAVVTEAKTLVESPRPGASTGYHKIARTYYRASNLRYDEVTFHVDISDQYEKRIKAEMAFTSQGHSPDFARIRFERTYGYHGWFARVNFAEKFVTDDLIVVDRLPVTEHDLTLSRDTIYDQHDRLGWSDDEERPDAAGGR